MAVRQIKQTILGNFFQMMTAVTDANADVDYSLGFLCHHLTSRHPLFPTCAQWNGFVFIKHTSEQMMIWKSAVIFVQLITQVHNLFLNDLESIFGGTFSEPIQKELHIPTLFSISLHRELHILLSHLSGTQRERAKENGKSKKNWRRK